MNGWQVDRAYVEAFASALSALGLSTVGLSPQSLELLKQPRAHDWWAGDALIGLLQELEPLHGRGGLEAISKRASHDGMARLVRPLIVNLLGLAGSPAHTLFSRIGMFTAVGCRGVDAKYTRTPDGCELTYAFPFEVPAIASVLWVGQIDLGLSLAGGGRVLERVETPTLHRFTLRFER